MSGVRNLTAINMACSKGINIISGKNAAGKTALLEGIHILAKATSFRTQKVKDVIQHGAEKLTVVATVLTDEDRKITTGIEKGARETHIKFNGERVGRRSEQARNLPVITITTESHQLVYGTPKQRRHWLDWSLFHVEPGYMGIWHDYHHALRQRNSLIRKKAGGRQFVPWEKQLAKKNINLRSHRQSFIEKLCGELKSAGNKSLLDFEILLASKEESEEQIFNQYQSRESDFLSGHTQIGAHREDVGFFKDGKSIGKIFSRGEGKLFIIKMLLAQARVFEESCRQKPLLLVDDLPAELDEDNRFKILQDLENQSLQTFITTTSRELLPVIGLENKVFHVEQGKIVKVVE